MKRQHGSARFADYFKAQVWDARSFAWRDIQRSCETIEEAQALLPAGKRGRIMRITEAGREPVLEVPA